MWLGAVIAEADAPGLALATLPDALERHEPQVRPAGRVVVGHRQGSAHLGLAARSADLLWAAREAELRPGGARGGPSGEPRAGARRAARELLALQSSDWAFMGMREPGGRLSAPARSQAHCAGVSVLRTAL